MGDGANRVLAGLSGRFRGDIAGGEVDEYFLLQVLQIHRHFVLTLNILDSEGGTTLILKKLEGSRKVSSHSVAALHFVGSRNLSALLSN